MAVAQRAPQAGDLLRGYRLLDLLGSGPHGQVFRARDEARARDAAVKLFHPHRFTPKALAHHIELAKVAAATSRSTACGILEMGTDLLSPFVAMELIDGQDLAHLLRQHGPLPWAPGKALLARCAAALAAAHQAGVLHTGLKPGNIRVIGEPGGRASVRLLDFGVGALLEHGNSGATRVHDNLSADYTSPEELRGEPPGPASDLYRLGVLFFELLTGHRPFEGRLQEVVRHHQRTPPPAPRSLASNLPPEADTLLLGLLEKTPERRPSAAQLRAQLSPEPAPHVRPVEKNRDEESPTQMWVRPPAGPPVSQAVDEPTGAHTVILMNPAQMPQASQGEVTLIPEGMGGEFLFRQMATPPSVSEQTSVLTNSSATVFVDRSRLPDVAPQRGPAPLPAWRRWLAAPWSFEKKLLTINVAFGLLILLGLLMLACSP